MSEYIKSFKDKGGDKNKINKLMSLRLDDDKLLENIKALGLILKILKILNFISH